MSVLQAVHCNTLESLGREWKWSTENLKYVGIGVLNDLIAILRGGNYKPTVTDAVKQRFAAK